MLQYRNVLLIVNPVAGQGFAPRYGRRITRLMQRRGLRVTVRETGGATDAERWCRTAADDGFDLICALGGDGTMCEAVAGQAKAERKVPIAHISSGTANVIPLALALPWLPGPALNAALDGAVRDFDVGYLPDLGRAFVLMAAIGYPASIIIDSPHRLKNLFGVGTYVVAAIRNLFRRQTALVTVVADGRRHRRRANTVMLTNIGRLNDLNLRVTPDTNPHDGLIDVTIISSRGLWDILVILFRMLTWRSPRVRRMKHFKATEVLVEADPPIPVQIDGESIGTTPVRAQVLPQAVRLVVGKRYSGG
jgi:YegS/Rv2252/BmrU family lipid kinase